MIRKMKKKGFMLVLFGLFLLYSLIMLFQLDKSISDTDLQLVEQKLRNYQISIWISWIFMVMLGIFYKWTQKRNLFFSLTYGFLFLAFSIFGTYSQLAV